MKRTIDPIRLEEPLIETFSIGRRAVAVIRDDCPTSDPTAPPFAKLRGLVPAIESRWVKGMIDAVGCLDSSHSRNGWGAAWVCALHNIPCHVFYPRRKADPPDLPPFQRKAEEIGAAIHPLPATRQFLLQHKMGQLMEGWHFAPLVLPNGLQIPEMVEATYETVCRVLDRSPLYRRATWIVPVGTGTLLRGVLRGLPRSARVVGVVGYKQNLNTLRERIGSHEALAGVRLIPSEADYRTALELDNPPFPMCPYYETKAWCWLQHNIEMLDDPIVFYNAGG